MKSSLIKRLLVALLLLFVLQVAACATGGSYAVGRPGSPTPAEQADPEFWKMLEEQRGIGG